jgi:hypothetical protein
MFFVLGTGRCGSTTIARVLDSLPGLACVHEPEPYLVREAYDYLAGSLSKDELIQRLRETRGGHPAQPRYGESNQKLSFMVAALRAAFPKADYLWLIRNGLAVVASTYYREWYIPNECHKDEWSAYRIQGGVVGAVAPDEWARMNSFEKNCWYWSWTNRKIRRDLEAHGARWKLVRLEDLDAQVPEIASFLGVAAPAAVEVPVLNLARSGKGKTTKVNYWDHAQRQTFTRVCGPLMDELYPGWRSALELSLYERVRNEMLHPLSRRSAFGRGCEAILRRLPRGWRRPIRQFAEGRRN